MQFLEYLFGDKKDTRIALLLFIAFSIYYVLSNYEIVHFISTVEIANGPFTRTPFRINIFNFDPSIYGAPGASVIHPLYNFLSTPLSYAARHTAPNYFMLLLQAVLNSMAVCMAYFYVRRSNGTNRIAVLVAFLFGASSYLTFTAFIPDSYPYVIFSIMLSLLYFQYSRLADQHRVAPTALLALINFGITSSNIVPFFGALVVNESKPPYRSLFRRLAQVVLVFGVFVITASLLQRLLFGSNSWILNWATLQSGGTRYVGDFSFSQHGKALYFYLVASPIVTPLLTLLDGDLMAIVTDTVRRSFVYEAAPLIIFFTAILGFARNFKQREVWVLLMYPLFAFVLHIIVGFGLSVYQYDMYLYAGHYLFSFFLLIGHFLISVKNVRLKEILTSLLFALAVVILIENILKHAEFLKLLQLLY